MTIIAAKIGQNGRRSKGTPLFALSGSNKIMIYIDCGAFGLESL